VAAALRAVVTVSVLAFASGEGRGQPSESDSGRRVYAEQCAICHGDRGDGRGHAAHHFRSAPRDFVAGRYKFRSTASGQLPTDDDLRRTITRGLPGTGMVPQNHLSAGDLEAVLTHIKSLSPRFATGPAPVPLPLPAEAPSGPAAVAQGQQVYRKAECQECHGPQARGDGPSARDLKVKPSDLTRRPFKGGPAARDTVRTLITGLDGTPMPSYHLILDDAELWQLAFYLDSIGTPPQETEDERAGWHVVRMHQRRSP
jgi:cytochrome c oxidase cbb3-type subunit 2